MKRSTIHIWAFMLLLTMGVLCFGVGEVAWAQTPPDSPQAGRDILAQLLQIVVLIQKVLFSLLVPVIAFIGSLLNNDLITGASVGLDSTLESVWVFVRNLVNIGFVLILLVMAFAHLLKSQSGDVGDYGIKTMLPNIVIAVVVVNFSLLGCRLLLDASAMTTSAVFSIPNTVGRLDLPFRDENQTIRAFETVKNGEVQECLRERYYFNIDRLEQGTTTTEEKPPTQGAGKVAKPKSTEVFVPMARCTDQGTETLNSSGIFYLQGNNGQQYCESQPYKSLNAQERQNQCISNMDQLLFNERSAMYAFAYGLLQLPNYEKVLSENITAANFTLSTVLSILMLAVIMVVIYVLFVALVIRVVVLWVLIATSPLWVLELVFKGGGPFKQLTDKISIRTFIALAFMPTLVGGVLSISFIILLAVKQGFAHFGHGAHEMSLGNMGLFFGSNPIMAGFTSIYDFIFSLLVVVALWVGVFAAIKSGDVTGLVANSVKSIENMGQEAARLAGKVPGALPVIPTPFGMQSAGAIGKGANTYMQSANNMYDDLTQKKADDMFGNLPGYRSRSANPEDMQKLSGLATAQNPTVENIINIVNNTSTQFSAPQYGSGVLSAIERVEKAGTVQEQTFLRDNADARKVKEALRTNRGVSNEQWESFIRAARKENVFQGDVNKALQDFRNRITGTTKSMRSLENLVTDKVRAHKGYKVVQPALAAIQTEDNGSFLTEEFMNALTDNGKLRTAAGAGQALKGKSIPESILQKLAEQLYPNEVQVFLVGAGVAQVTTPGQGTPPPTGQGTN